MMMHFTSMWSGSVGKVPDEVIMGLFLRKL